MTLVKICGITREEDATLATQLGADFLGFIFVKESPRCVTPEVVRDIGGATKVGVFRNASLDEIQRIADVAQLDLIQLHGDESDDDVRAMPLPVIKAFNVRDALPATNTSAKYVMFDSGGGTGRTFDWSLLAQYDRAKPFFLAGGINADNVDDALRIAPDAIDLASGVERAPGIKDHDKLKRLFERVKR
ncbi:MAG TPA: phosphoribosylanthranilate isomerase [Thermoanaerobaculia bacterium]